MTALSLRPAVISDIPALSRLGCESFTAKFGGMYDHRDLATFLDDTHSPAALARELADPAHRYCLAELEGRLAGYCKMALPSSLAEHARGVRPAEIKQLYTDPMLTGRGIGAALMDWAFAQARGYGADELQLSVWSGNDDAQRFYARHGFAKTADIHFRVGDQIDEEYLFALML